MNAPPEFGKLDCAAVAALVLELAAQLHVERSRRLALEAALSERHVVEPKHVSAAGDTAEVRAATARAADDSVRRLLRVLSESPNQRAPLRAEAPRADGDNP